MTTITSQNVVAGLNLDRAYGALRTAARPLAKRSVREALIALVVVLAGIVAFGLIAGPSTNALVDDLGTAAIEASEPISTTNRVTAPAAWDPDAPAVSASQLPADRVSS